MRGPRALSFVLVLAGAAIADDFEDYVDLTERPNARRHINTSGRLDARGERNMAHYAHLSEAAIRASFARKAARFRALLAAPPATALLFVYINDDYTYDARYRGHDEIHEGVACIEALLATRHPQLNFTILFVDFVPHPPSAFGRIIHHYVNWTAQGEQLVHDPLNPPPMRTPEAFFFHTVRWGNVLRQHL